MLYLVLIKNISDIIYRTNVCKGFHYISRRNSWCAQKPESTMEAGKELSGELWCSCVMFFPLWPITGKSKNESKHQ